MNVYCCLDHKCIVQGALPDAVTQAVASVVTSLTVARKWHYLILPILKPAEDN